MLSRPGSFRGLQKAEEVLRDTDHTIVFASDNVANLRRILKPSKIGPCQLVGVWMNDILKRLGRKVIFLWSPSHVGIERNEEADMLAGDMAKWPWTREEDRPGWQGTHEPLYGDIERYNAVWLKTGDRDILVKHDLPSDISYAYRRKEIRETALREWRQMLSLPDAATRVPVVGIPDNSIRTQPSAYMGHSFWWDEELGPSLSGKA